MLLLMCDGEAADGVVIWGEEGVQSGAYVLRIRVERPLTVVFGRHRGGRPLAVPAGHVIYVGSAMGRKGSTTLARRLLRHVTRSGQRPPHSLRASLLHCFRRAGLGSRRLKPPEEKRLHWHVDYLLDEVAAELDAVLAIRSSRRKEEQVAGVLARWPHTAALSQGLGATDAAARTHLLCLAGGAAAWPDLLRTLRGEILDHQDDADPGRQDQ